MTGRFGPDAEVDVAKSYGRFVPRKAHGAFIRKADCQRLP